MPDFTMLPSELRELLADVAHVKLQDVHLGRVLETIVAHLAHAHGLDITEAQANEPETASESAAESGEDDGEDGEDQDKTVEVKAVKGKK